MADMGQRINQKRLEMGLTMEELGKMVGVGASAVNKWEKRCINPHKQRNNT